MGLSDQIGESFDVCPSCNSDDWKSAKLIVMEGTSSIKGDVSGTSKDPGMFSGGMRNFLLSDRWFSWDHQINMEVGLTQTSGLVDEVKRIMVENGEQVAMPEKPVLPEEPSKPIAPFSLFKTKLVKPEKPTLKRPVEPIYKSWHLHFLDGIKDNSVKLFRYWIYFYLAAAFMASLITQEIYRSFTLGFQVTGVLFLSLFLLSVPYFFISSIGKNKSLKKKYQSDLKSFQDPDSCYKFRYANDKYEKSLVAYNVSLEKEKKKNADQEILNKQYESELASYQFDLDRYNLDLEKYNSDVKQVELLRENLWNRARICMRCGSGYLGNSEIA